MNITHAKVESILSTEVYDNTTELVAALYPE